MKLKFFAFYLLVLFLLPGCTKKKTENASGDSIYVLPDRIRPGESMLSGETKTSPNGEYELRFQDDGNLCVYKGTNLLSYSMQTLGIQKLTLLMNGRLIGFKISTTGGDVPIQCTFETMNVDRLQFEDDGSLAIYNISNVKTWDWSMGFYSAQHSPIHLQNFINIIQST